MHEVRIGFGPAGMARLELLKTRCNVDTYSEVITNGLRLYEALIDMSVSGKAFYTRDANGVMERLELFES